MTSANCRPPAWRMPGAPQLDAARLPAIAARAAGLGVLGHAVHQDVDVRAHQPAAARITSTATKSAATESPS